MAKRNILLREFNVQVYANGRLMWDGLDSFLWWRLHRIPKEDLLPFAVKISKLGRKARPVKKKQ